MLLIFYWMQHVILLFGMSYIVYTVSYDVYSTRIHLENPKGDAALAMVLRFTCHNCVIMVRCTSDPYAHRGFPYARILETSDS